jgi:hypothetical protein
MYVEGNPVRYRDDTGHSKNNAMLGAVIGYVMAPQFGLSPNEGAALGAGIGMGDKGKNSNILRNVDHGATEIAKNSQGWVNYQMATNFGFVRVKGDPGENITKTIKWAVNGIDGVVHPHKKENDFQRSDIGKFVTNPIEVIKRSDFSHLSWLGVKVRNWGEFLAGAIEVIGGVGITAITEGEINGLPMAADGVCRIGRSQGGKGESDCGGSDNWGSGHPNGGW